jgi:hypothetical protein
MEKEFSRIETLKARARMFRVSAEDCRMPDYAALMRKGAAHLDEQAQLLEARLDAPSFAFAPDNATEETER